MSQGISGSIPLEAENTESLSHHYTEIDHCKSASNSKCEKCKVGYKLNDNGNECVLQIVAIIVGSIISTIFLILLIVIIIIIITLKTLDKKNDYQQLPNVDILQIAKLNIPLYKLNKSILSSKKIINFNDENQTIPVNQETKTYLIIGNNSYNRQKIQIIAKEGNDKYEIKINPEMISLAKGMACEFEITLKPFCSFEIEDEIMIVSVDIKKGTKDVIPIQMIIKTDESTRINYDDIHIGKQIGEGTFGVVYKGTYKGNEVAIKKMKSIADEAAIKEFEKEMNMLDKFRSDYIIHFYGACFIPNKLSIVTEYAPYGSISDIMNRNKEYPPSINLRMKFILDGAKGIKYLHDNNILHRDIKPDNYLVISVDENPPVNCKLTDFGSSRNINALMTNMTFTKGIGTPAFMAPEILKRQHYKKPADIYSFAVTMYEIINWDDAFSKSEFRFPWQIAEFISFGKRPKQTSEISQSQYKLIQQCWCHNPHDRLEIDDVISCVETEILKLHQFI